MTLFTPRSYETILNDSIAYMKALTAINDFTVGSVIRTILEAAAIEDDEQYFQMAQLLDMFSFLTSEGPDLDRRLADFNLFRKNPQTAATKLRFFDNNAVTTSVAVETTGAVTSIQVFNSTKFPSVGPYVIRVGENTSRVQDVSVLTNNSSTGVFTLAAATLFDIQLGDRTTLVTGATSRVVSIGTTAQAPATTAEPTKTFIAKEIAYIPAGNLFSNEVRASCTIVGTPGNVGINRVNKFSGAAPFSGCGVLNTIPGAGGADRESDQDFRTRALKQLQSLSRGTPLAIVSSALDVVDPITGQRVVSASLYEDFSSDEVILYIDDGTGLDPDTSVLPSDGLAVVSGIGDTSITINTNQDFPTSGIIFVDDLPSPSSELVNYASKGANTLNLSSGLVNAHNLSTLVYYIDEISAAAESGQRRFNLTNFPVVRASDRIWVKAPSASSWVLLSRGVDYKLNKGTGEFQILSVAGLEVGTQVIANYTYYINLIASVQRTEEGVLSNPGAYPGVKAAGIFLSVEPPILKRITVISTITASPGFSEADIAPLVQSALENYISSLKIGEDVIQAKLIDVAFNISGVADIHITMPLNNVVVLERELAVPFGASDESLVTVN